MNCPHCSLTLKEYKELLHTNYMCDNDICKTEEMPRYTITYNHNNQLIGQTLMLGQYYIQIDYQRKTTTISTLYIIILKDSITINHVLPVDLNNLNILLNKIKTIMVFS